MVPARSFHHRRSSAAILAAVRQKLHGERIQAFSRCRAMTLKVVLQAINAARCKFRFGQ